MKNILISLLFSTFSFIAISSNAATSNELEENPETLARVQLANRDIGCASSRTEDIEKCLVFLGRYTKVQIDSGKWPRGLFHELRSDISASGLLRTNLRSNWASTNSHDRFVLGPETKVNFRYSMPLSAVQYQITLSWNTPENEILKAYEDSLQQVLKVAEAYTKYQGVFGESFATFFPFEAEAGQGVSKNNLCRNFYEIGFSARNDWTVGPVEFNQALTKCNQNLLKLEDALSRVEPLAHQEHNVGWSAVEFVFQAEEKQNIDGCRPYNVSNSVWKLFNLTEETPVVLSCENTHEEYYKIHLLSDKFTVEDIISVLIDVKEDHKAKIERGYHYLYKWR